MLDDRKGIIKRFYELQVFTNLIVFFTFLFEKQKGIIVNSIMHFMYIFPGLQ